VGTAGGAVNVAASVSASNVALTASGGNLTLGSGVTVNGTNGVTLATSAHFVNNAGASALNGGSGRWLVYSSSPVGDTTGGLTPDFYQYAANIGAFPAASGNGLLYALAPTLGVSLSGIVTKTYDGTTAATFSNANAPVTGLVNGDTALVTGTYASKNAGTGIAVTASSIAVSHNGIAVYGYAGTTPSVSANIGQIDRATIGAAIVGDPTKTYNGTTTATLISANYQLTGFAAGESATVNQPSSIAYDSADAGTRTLNATFSATNFIAGAGTDFANYILPTVATGSGHILQAPLLISGVLALDKVYDQSVAALLNTSGASLYGIIGGDDVSLVTSGALGAFATANAGANIAVSTSGFALSGTRAANYQLVQPSGLTASITPRGLTLSGVSANSKVYDATSAAALSFGSASLVGILSGDNIVLDTAGATGTFASVDVGTSIAVAASGFGLGGTAAGNYQLTQPTGLAADITPRSLAVSITGNPTKTYNGNASAVLNPVNFLLTGFAGSDGATVDQISQASYATANAGTQLVTASLAVSDYVAVGGTKLSNYILPTSVTGMGTIAQAPITIAIDGNPSKSYDGNVNASLTGANFRLSGFLIGQGATVNPVVGAYDGPNVGVHGITVTLGAGDLSPVGGTLLSNYAFPSVVTGFGSITPAALGAGIYASIAGNPTKTYDGNVNAILTAANFLLTGFAPGEGATVTETHGTYADKNVGTQVVSVNLDAGDFTPNSGTDLSNYTLPTFAFGTGTIDPATLTATIINNPTKVYNGTNVATVTSGNFSVAGLAPGESINILGASQSSYDSIHAGSRTVTAQIATTDITPGAGTLLSNYILPTTASGAGLITQAPLVILGLSVADKTYDTTTAASLQLGGANLYGVVGSDDVSLVTGGASAVFNSANAGTSVSVTASGFAISGGAVSDYQLFQPTGLAAAINRAALTVTNVTAQNKVYDGLAAATLNLGTAGLSGVLAADAGNVALNTGSVSASFTSVNVGSGLAVIASGFGLSGAQASNYVLSQPAGLAANITPRPLVANIVGNPTKVYDGSTSTTLTAANYDLVGFVLGQGATVPQSAAANYIDPNAGSRTINSTLVSSDFVANSGTNLSNYILPTSATGTGTITRAPLVATIIGNPTKTYNTTTAATLTSANFMLTGFVGGQGATVTETAGIYGSANAGGRSVTATLDSGDFTAGGSTNLANYILPISAVGTGTINQAVLNVINVTANNKVYDGNVSATLNTGSAALSGVLGSDLVSLGSGGAGGVFATRNAGTGIGVTASGFTISGAASSNYTLVQPTGLIADITQKSISLTEVRRIYNANTSVAGSTYTLGGVIAGDTVTVDASGISGNFVDKNVGTAKNVTLSGVALGGAQAGNYSIAGSVTDAAIGTITPAALTANGIVALDKIYDGNTSATLDNSAAGLLGLLGSDNVTLVTSGAAGTFNNKNAGSNKTVTLAGYTVTGTDAANYTFTQPASVLADITQFTGLTLTSVTKIYDGTTSLPTINGAYTLGGIVGSDAVQVNAGALSGSYAGKDVGTGLSVSITGLTLTGADAANYSIGSSVTNALIGIINPKALTAAIIGTPTRTYDSTTAAVLASGNYSLSGFVAGEGATVTETSGLYSSADAGARTVTATLDAGDFTANGGTLLSNYILPTSASGGGQINRAPLTITGVVAGNKIYDGNVSAVLNTSGAALSGVFASDLGGITLGSGGASGVFASPDVGTSIAVTASGFTIGGARSSNYTLAQPTGLLADISRALLTLTSVIKVYDATNSAVGAGVSYTLGGIVGGDVVQLDTGGLAGTYAGKNVGTGLGVSMSGLALTGADAANYSIASSVSNALIGTITPATLTISGMLAQGRVYDGSNLATIDNGATTLVGVLGSDVVGFSATPGTGTFASSNVGTWAVTLGGSYAITGADAGNYVLTQPTGLTAAITPAQLTVSIIGNPTKTYDGTSAATLVSGNYSLTGFVAGQSATVNQTVGTYDSADAGSRTVTASLSGGNFVAGGGTLLSNYILPTTATGAGTIDPRALLVSIIGTPTRTYDGTSAATLTAGNYSLTGFVAGQGATIGKTTGAYDSANAGGRTVTTSLVAGDFTAGAGTNLANYLLPTSATGAGLINQKQLTAALIGNPTKTYDGTDAATLTTGNYGLSGFVAGEGATVTETAGVYDSANAGSRTVTAILASGDFIADGGTLLSNYILPTSAVGAGLIDPKLLTVSIIGNPTKTYDGTASASLSSGDYALAGFIAGEGATVTQTVGSYDMANAGGRIVTALLGGGDFAATGGTLLSNYVLPTSAAGAGLIDPRLLTAAITGNPVKTYDGTNAATLASGDYALSGFVAGEGATVTQIAGTYASADAGSWGVAATLGSGDFAATGGTLLSNYILPTTAVGTGTIDPRTLLVSIIGTPTKTYDGTNAATLASGNYSLTGFIAGEGATIDQTAGAYDSANAGGRTVTASLSAGNFAAAGGTNLANYVLPTSAIGAGLIDPKLLTVSIIGTPTKTYDGTSAAALTSGNYVLGGFIAGEGATVTQTAGLYDTANAGSRTVTANLASGDFAAAGGTLLSNYVLPTSATGVGLIDPKLLTAAITGNPTKTYDAGTAATLTSGDYTLSGFVVGEGAAVIQTAGTYASADAGNWGVTAVLGSGDFAASGGTLLSNYILPAVAAGTGTIDPKALAVVIIGTPTKTYDGTNTATLTSGNYSLSGFVAGQGATIGETAGNYDSPNAGSRTITALLDAGDFSAGGGTNLANYVLPTLAVGAGLIDPKLLTAVITGTPTKTYDGTTTATLTSGDYSLTGFIAGEGAAVTQATGTYASANVGSWGVSAVLGSGDFAAAGGTLLSNYVLPTTAAGSGVIDPKLLTVAITGNPAKTYDGGTAATLVAGDYTLNGFVAGQGATVTQAVGTYDSPNAGARTVTATLGAGDFSASGATDLANYILPTVATGAGTIDPKALLVSIIGTPTKTYDGTTAATLTSGNYALTGFIAGEGATVTQTAGLYDSSNAGNRTVTATLGSGDFAATAGTLLSNYVLPAAAIGTGLIDPKLLTVAITGNPTKTYDATTSATLGSSDYTLTGFVAGEGASVTQTAGAYASADAGSWSVTALLGGGDFAAIGGTDLANYVLPTAATGIGTIDPRLLTAAIIGTPTKTYDGNASATLTSGNYSLTGFVAGQGATIGETAGSYDSPNAGSRTITALLDAGDFTAGAGTNLANYVLPASATGAGLIDPKALMVSIVGTPTKTYDGTSAAALTSGDYALSGFVSGEGATVTQTAGRYDSANAGGRTVTALLVDGDFAATGGTLLSNYVLPTSATGSGIIDPKLLTVAITGNPTKTYDGTTAASLGSSDYTLTGFVAGEGASVTQTAGTYASADAGAWGVSATLGSGDFAATGGTLLSNYILPTVAAGTGTIDPKALAVVIVGTPTKTYDGNTGAVLGANNYSLTGFIAGQGATITRTTGSYDAANAGDRTITTSLDTGDFAAGSGTNLANYVLPTAAIGAGLIDPKLLAATIVGNPTKTYDGSSVASLDAANFALSGFVAGEGATVTQTVGVYDSANAGDRTVSAQLGAGNLVAGAGTDLGNYVLPAAAVGIGKIDPKALAVAIIGNPTKVADGTTIATLSPDNFALQGFVAGEGATVTRTEGSYDTADPGSRTITAALGAGDYAASSDTLLSNYVLPTSAVGAGSILPAIETDAPSLDQAIIANLTISGATPGEAAAVAQRIVFGLTMPRSYIPYPSPSALSTWQNSGYAMLPSIIRGGTRTVAHSDNQLTISTGQALINSTAQILLQGDKEKAWTIALPPLPASISAPPSAAN
jgi:hypothetical protein